MLRLLFIAPVLLDTRRRTLPVNWRRWVTPMYEIMPKESRTGLMRDYQLRATIRIKAAVLIRRDIGL
jgi:hypothetical protein